MSNHLYYLLATDADGNSRDLMVVAADPAGAFEQWELYYHPDAQEWRDSDMGSPHDYAGVLHIVNDDERAILEKCEGISTIGVGEADMRFMRVSTDLSRPRPLEWHTDDMLLVAYIKEGQD